MTSNASLVSPQWVAERLNEFQQDDPDLRLVEITGGLPQLPGGHIPGATILDLDDEFEATKNFDMLSRSKYETVVGKLGITPESTVVLYSGQKNTSAAYAYWHFTYFGHDTVCLLDGGKEYWSEMGYPTTNSPSDFNPRRYEVSTGRPEIRATITEVERATHGGDPIISVRDPKEHTGSLIYTLIWATLMLRGELSTNAIPRFIKNSLFSKPHIPGSNNIPLETIVDQDGTLKSVEQLRSIAERNQLSTDQDIVLYCAAGYRSSLFWFVLSELLEFNSVRNYDGSWVEWGSQS